MVACVGQHVQYLLSNHWLQGMMLLCTLQPPTTTNNNRLPRLREAGVGSRSRTRSVKISRSRRARQNSHSCITVMSARSAVLVHRWVGSGYMCSISFLPGYQWLCTFFSDDSYYIATNAQTINHTPSSSVWQSTAFNFIDNLNIHWIQSVHI